MKDNLVPHEDHVSSVSDTNTTSNVQSLWIDMTILFSSFEMHEDLFYVQ